MFVLAVALIVGIVAGYALGGRLRNLEHLQLRLAWLVLLALGIQLVIFSPLGAPLNDTVIVTCHLVSYACLLAFAAANWRSVGVLVAGAGTALNAAAIAANGGYMPATETALRLAGRAVEAEPHNNSALAGEGVRLLFLGDVMAVPDWVPFVANVFSVGDVLIAGGVAVMLAMGMRSRATVEARAVPAAVAGLRVGLGAERPSASEVETALDAIAASVSRLTAYCSDACSDASEKALGAAVALMDACETLLEERDDDLGLHATTSRSSGPRRTAPLRATDGEPEAQ